MKIYNNGEKKMKEKKKMKKKNGLKKNKKNLKQIWRQ